jgi:hypothetical protein
MCGVSRLRVAYLVLVAVLALTAMPVEAHRGPPASPAPAVRLDAAPEAAPQGPIASVESRLAWVAGPERGEPVWALLAMALAAAALLAGRRRPRAVLALALVLLVAVLTFESGVHSVHHLDDPSRGSACALASTSQQLSGMEVGAVGLERAPVGPGVALSAPVAAAPLALPESPHEGRAPPRLV